MTLVEQFDASHNDKVVALHVNFDGTRVLTASIDHRIKVWTRDSTSGELTLLDVFKAHDGDIKDAKWLHPTLGTHLLTIGSDRLLRLFSHDPSASPLSGRCFPPTMQISSKTPHPFVSLDIHTRNNIYTTLAVIDRSGLLTIFVPDTPDRLIEWRVLAQWAVLTPPPTPGEETSFKVRWDPNPQGLPYVNSLTDVKDTLRLVVSAMDTIKIYHALPADSTNPALQFHLEASLAPYPGVLVRDVAWAPFNVRGTDLLATAGRNGAVSIIEMGYKARVGDGDGKAGGKFVRQAAISSPMSTATPISRPPPQSHLSSALASRPHPGTPSNTSPSLPSTSQAPNPLPYSTTLRIVTTNPSAHDDAWSLAWDPAGQVLMSNGSEGRTVMWKKSILEGEWREFSSVEFEVEEEEEEGEEEREGWVV